MPLYDIIKSLLGIPTQRDDSFDRNSNRQRNEETNDYRSQFWGPHSEQYDDFWSGAEGRPGLGSQSQHSDSDDVMTGAGFHVFTDPLQMQRYFEQQINEVLSSFSNMFGPPSHDRSLFGFGEMPRQPPEQPQLEPPQTEKSLREQYLKPGYESRYDPKPKLDTDLDGKVNLGDLDSMLQDKGTQTPVNPYQEKPTRRVFGQTLTSTSIQRADGTVETVRSMRDHDGNEETTVTRRLGDKEYTVTTRTDKNGHQQKTETMCNIDEQELSRFTGQWRAPPHLPDANPNLFFPFDKFFK